MRRQTRGRRWLGMTMVAALLLLPALALRPGAAGAQDTRPTLRFGVNAADLQTLDPHKAAGTQDRTVVDMVFNGLVRYKPGDSSQMEPDLATAIPEPAMENGKQTWTFTLRDGVMCQPSAKSAAYPLTADNVVFSLQKAASPDTSGYSADYKGLTVAKVDAKTVKITLDQPISATLFLPKVANYSGGFIICQKAYQALGDAFATQPVGTGPFMYQAYTPQTSLELVANDQYFRGKPKLAGVSIRYMADATSRELALQSGELDAAAGVPQADWVDRINSAGQLQADVFGVGEVVFINLDVTNQYLKDPKVRQAIALAVDRGAHVALNGAPVAQPVYSVVPAQLMPGGLTMDEAKAAGVLYQKDTAKAKQLLAEAGYPNGFSIKLVTSEMEAYRSNYEVLQSELGDIGIKVDLTVVDHATMHAQIRQGVNPVVIYIAYRPNADVYLTQFFSSASVIVTGSNPNANFSRYTGIDDLIQQARAETDPAKQAQIWQQANIKILQDVAAIPLDFQNQVYARQKSVDYGHKLVSVLALYPGIDETTTITT